MRELILVPARIVSARSQHRTALERPGQRPPEQVEKHGILVLATDMKRLGFMSMYEQNFVLKWVFSIPAAEELARAETFAFALVNFDADPKAAISFCERLKSIQPGTQVIYMKTDSTPLPEDFCADLVVDTDLNEVELASILRNALSKSA